MACEEIGIVCKTSTNDDPMLEEEHGNIWDDTELIKAYDRAVASLKVEIQSEESESTNTTRRSSRSKKKRKGKKHNANKKKSSWSVDEKCLAVFSEDGLYYEATILSVDESSMNVYVRFDYYENEEEVPMDTLLPVECKVDMEPANTTEVYGGSEHSCSQDEPGTSQDETELRNWKVSDLCYVRDDKGIFQQAVLNSFVSSKECNITFVHNKKRQQVYLFQLLRSLPTRARDYKNDAGSNSPWRMPFPTPYGTFSSFPTSSEDSGIFGGNFPPFPSFPSCSTSSYNPLFMNFTPPTPPAPPPPPPPLLSEEIMRGDEEALANLMMSWYMTGYHTGYYRGITNSTKELDCQKTSRNRKKR